MDFNLSFSAFIGICGLVVWFLVQRQIKANDDAAKETAEGIRKKFEEQGQRIGSLDGRIQRAELEMSTKVGREELDKLYDKIDENKKEMKEDLKDLKKDLLDAIAHRSGGAQ